MIRRGFPSIPPTFANYNLFDIRATPVVVSSSSTTLDTALAISMEIMNAATDKRTKGLGTFDETKGARCVGVVRGRSKRE